MKICMGDKKADDTEPNGTEAHYGYPFIVQANRTLVCDVTDEKLFGVIKNDIRLDRIMLYDVYLATKRQMSESKTEMEDDPEKTFEKYIESEKKPKKPASRSKPKGRPPAKPAAKKEPEKEPEKDPEPDKKE